jgi:hypothetical protein
MPDVRSLFLYYVTYIDYIISDTTHQELGEIMKKKSTRTKGKRIGVGKF